MEKKSFISVDDMTKLLDDTYAKVLGGIPKVSPSIEEFANDYLSKHNSKEEACKDMMDKQILKCTTSGVVTGFGGIVTIPFTLPANLVNVLYVQIRMIACTAYMAGYDLQSDQTQTFVYSCLAGVAINKFLKKAGIAVGEKVATKLVQKVPGKVLIAINKKVGFRLLTKFGSKGIVNIGKLIPVVGAAVSGSLDYGETKVIASRSYKWFFEGDFDSDVKTEVYDDLDIDDEMEFEVID